MNCVDMDSECYLSVPLCDRVERDGDESCVSVRVLDAVSRELMSMEREIVLAQAVSAGAQDADICRSRTTNEITFIN